MRGLLKQTLRFKKLNTSGVAHHALIAVLVISAFASLGAYRIFSSSAATNNAAPPLSAQGLKENGCVPGEHKNDKNQCEPFVKIEKIKDDCALYKLPYGAENKRCRTGQCIDGYEKKGPDCVKKRVTPQAPPATDQPTATDSLSEEMCKLLGREPASANKCKRVCVAGAGSMLTKGDTRYCQHAVAESINQERCKQLNRKWVGSGCARLVGQKDTLNALQCLPGFPYYNANFKGDATNTDVCEKDKNTADQNEQNGVLGGQPVGGGAKPEDPTKPDDCNQADASARCAPQDPGDDDDAGAARADYRIILFKEKDFKGDKLDVTATLNDDDTVTMTVKADKKKLEDVTDLAKMPKGWNDKVKSFKVMKGRWQLCEDASYEKGCIKPYASDPNVADGKNKKKISSARPFVKTVQDETVDEFPAPCIDANGQPVQLDQVTNKCPDNTKLTCPETDGSGNKLELKGDQCIAVTIEADVVVPVDTSFKGKQGERKCKLLGREWISAGNGGEHGCSIETCKNHRDGRPRTVQVTGDSSDDQQKRTDTVCISYKHDVPYAVKLDPKAKQSEKKCEELSRIWIEQVKLCAQVPNRDDKNQTIVKAEQCAGKKTTYYIYKEKAKTDECFNPNYFDRAKGVAKSVGGSLSAALKQGPKAYCKVAKGGKYHWQDGKCVIDRHKCWNGDSLPVGQKCPPKPDAQGGRGADGSEEPDGGGEKAPDGGSWSAFCAKLGRSAVGNNCSSQCINYPEFVRDPDSTYWGYDKCRAHELVCDKYQGGARPCGGGGIRQVDCTEYRRLTGANIGCVVLRQVSPPPAPKTRVCDGSGTSSLYNTATIQNTAKSIKTVTCYNL